MITCLPAGFPKNIRKKQKADKCSGVRWQTLSTSFPSPDFSTTFPCNQDSPHSEKTLCFDRSVSLWPHHTIPFSVTWLYQFFLILRNVDMTRRSVLLQLMDTLLEISFGEKNWPLLSPAPSLQYETVINFFFFNVARYPCGTGFKTPEHILQPCIAYHDVRC